MLDETADLLMYRSLSQDSREPSAAAAAAATECAIKAIRPGQPAASHNLCQVERLGPKAGSMTSQGGQEPAAAAGAEMADTPLGNSGTPSRVMHAKQPAYEPEELRGGRCLVLSLGCMCGITAAWPGGGTLLD